MRRSGGVTVALISVTATLAVGCVSATVSDDIGTPETTIDPVATADSATSSAAAAATTSTAPVAAELGADQRTPIAGVASPDWLGTIELELRPGERIGVAQPTPPALTDRRFWTTDVLPPPASDAFVFAIETPPPTLVVARSTWQETCPIDLAELAYVQVAFVGFDGLHHTGELLVHVDHANAIVDVFAQLHKQRFPFEEIRVTRQDELTAPRTGDDNNTSSFVCRPPLGGASSSWSQHAYGLAIDINPFHNPYVKGDLVVPELATAYLDRSRQLPGMVTSAEAALFAGLGWGWGGDWNSASDWMHFSNNGR